MNFCRRRRVASMKYKLSSFTPWHSVKKSYITFPAWDKVAWSVAGGGGAKASRLNPPPRTQLPYELLQTQASGIYEVQTRLLACTPWFFADVEIIKLQSRGSP
jgi:hypothetical protein